MSTVTNGARTETGPARTAPSTWAEAPSYKGHGWIVFAGIMLLVSATLNLIWGISAVADAHFFIGNAAYIISDLNFWGWVAMGFALLQVLAALSIWRGGAFGRWFGITVAAFALIAAMMSIPAYPLWSLMVAAIDALVIYGLAVYGGKEELA